MFTLIAVLLIAAALLLVLVVLVQNPKGGGIASNFNFPNQIIGVQKSTDLIERLTWIFAIAILTLSLASNFFKPETAQGGSGGSQMQEEIDSRPMPQQPQQPQQPSQQPNGGGEQPAPENK